VRTYDEEALFALRVSVAFLLIALIAGLSAPTEARMTHDVFVARHWLRQRTDDRHFACLHKLISAESGWKVHNRYGRAYGLGQALPGRKMRSAERPARGPLWDSWRHDALVQASWTLHYIRGRYRGSCAAWRHFERFSWY
jgi:hypothetical protein